MILPYEILNPEDRHKPWIVCINGLFTSRQSWKLCSDHLRDSFRVLTYDGRGQGEGPRPNEAYRFDDLCLDLRETLDAAGVRECFLLGISQGGRIALKFAEHHPGLALGVIAADTYHELTPLLTLKINSWLVAHRAGGALTRFDIAAPWIWSEAVLRERPELYEFYRNRSGIENDRVIERLIESALEGSVELARIQCPVVYVVGEEDCLTPPHAHRRMAELTPRAAVVEVRGGHASLLEFPESLGERVLPVFRELLSLSSPNREPMRATL